MKLAFIGGGNMAAALIGGLVARGHAATDVVVVDPSSTQRDALVARFPGLVATDAVTAGHLRGATLAVLAVKPQQLRDACTALGPHAHALPAVLSIAAGVRCAEIARWLGGYPRIVRAMPNTPALVGQGIAGVYVMPDVPEAGRAAAEAVLAAAGDVVACPREAMLDAVTGVSGSGPAYVFYFIEGLVAAALELGFGEADARKLAYATFAGSVALAQASPEEPATLRARVTSKGGTTAAGIGVLDAAHVKQHFVDAVKAAAARARELGDAAAQDGTPC
ncbi:MAG: pyrroline-5-carboxylate reductase [Proteobacteria bacterium]|nr:pyrroline-5-carboxylate reductase [Pseudomonadota bacterium]